MDLTKHEIFELGRRVAGTLSGSVLKPTQSEIRDAAKSLNMTLRDVIVSLEYYNYGHTYREPPVIHRRKL